MSRAIFGALLLLCSLCAAGVEFCSSPSFTATVEALEEFSTPFLTFTSRDACGRSGPATGLSFGNLTGSGGLLLIDTFSGTASSPATQPVEVVELDDYNEAQFVYTSATQILTNDPWSGTFTIALRCYKTSALAPAAPGDVEVLFTLEGTNTSSSVDYAISFSMLSVVNNGSTLYPAPGYVRVSYPTSSSSFFLTSLFSMSATIDGAVVALDDGALFEPPVASSLALTLPAFNFSVTRSFFLNTLTSRTSASNCDSDDDDNNSLWSRAYRYWDNHLWLQIVGPAGLTALILFFLLFLSCLCCVFIFLILLIVVVVVIVVVVIVILVVVLVVAAGGGSVISVILGKKRRRADGRKTIIYAGGPQLSSSSEDGYMEEEYDDNVEVEEEDENVFDEDESEGGGEEEEEEEEEESEEQESDIDEEYVSDEEED